VADGRHGEVEEPVMSVPSVQLYSVRDAFAADPDDTLRRLAAIGETVGGLGNQRRRGGGRRGEVRPRIRGEQR